MWVRVRIRYLIGNHLSSGSLDWIDDHLSRIFRIYSLMDACQDTRLWYDSAPLHSTARQHRGQLNGARSPRSMTDIVPHYVIIGIIVDFNHLCNIHHMDVGIRRRGKHSFPCSLARALAGLTARTTMRNAIVWNSTGNLCNYSHCIVFVRGPLFFVVSLAVLSSGFFWFSRVLLFALSGTVTCHSSYVNFSYFSFAMERIHVHRVMYKFKLRFERNNGRGFFFPLFVWKPEERNHFPFVWMTRFWRSGDFARIACVSI